MATSRKPGPNMTAAREAAEEAKIVTPIWAAKLIRSKTGPKDFVANAITILTSDPEFVGNIRFDEMFSAAFCRSMPWRRGDEWREWTDVDDVELANWCQRRKVTLKPATCASAIAVVADHHRHHAVREYLDGLVWDQVPRLDNLLSTYFRATDAESGYLAAVGAAFMIGAVARVRKPGCQVDHALILEGPQGIYKSTALRTLVGDEWFADEISDLGSKDSAQDLRGKWLIELSELSAMTRSAVERVKAFLTRRVDHYRPSYGRRSMDFPRQCVFAGSTNSDKWLPDETGGRRFWPIKTTGPDVEAIRRDRDQLWAEADFRYRNGEQLWLNACVTAQAKVEQEKRRIPDPWEEPIKTWLLTREKNPPTTGEVLSGALERSKDQWNRRDEMRVAACMKALGYERKSARDRDGGRSNRWFQAHRA